MDKNNIRAQIMCLMRFEFLHLYFIAFLRSVEIALHFKNQFYLIILHFNIFAPLSLRLKKIQFKFFRMRKAAEVDLFPVLVLEDSACCRP